MELAAPLVALFGAGVYLSSECLLRRGRARDFERGPFDHNTTWMAATAVVFALLAPWITRGTFDAGRGWPGAGATILLAAVMAAGIALRFWAMSVLGESFTRTLRIAPEQRLVTSGPYRLIRHPGYLSAMVVLAPYSALVSSSWFLPLLVLAVFGLAYRFRISAEEDMLARALGDEYRDYQKHTWKLIPWLF